MVAITVCVHAWKIEPAQGPTSEGYCQRCGATQTFKNFVEIPKFPGWKGESMVKKAVVDADRE